MPLNFAPLSNEPSSRLRLVSGYLSLSGALAIASSVIGLGWLAAHWGAAAHHTSPVLMQLVRAASGAVLVFTGMGIGYRRRGAGVVAALVFATPLVSALFGQHEPRATIWICAAGVLLIASVARELGPDYEVSDA